MQKNENQAFNDGEIWHPPRKIVERFHSPVSNRSKEFEKHKDEMMITQNKEYLSTVDVSSSSQISFTILSHGLFPIPTALL